MSTLTCETLSPYEIKRTLCSWIGDYCNNHQYVHSLVDVIHKVGGDESLRDFYTNKDLLISFLVQVQNGVSGKRESIEEAVRRTFDDYQQPSTFPSMFGGPINIAGSF